MTQTIVRYEPKGAARQLLECTEPEVLIAGPAGTGKSMAMLFKVHLACLKVPGVRALLVRQTHASLTGTTLVTFERKVAAPTLANGTMYWFGGSAREPAAYRYSNGSVLLVGGLDRPEKFLSSEFDLVAVDEATEITETAFETLISRLRGTALVNKQIILACNPDAPIHHLKLRADRGATVMLHSRHEDNPVLFGEDGQLTEFGAAYIAKLDRLTGVRYLRLRKGLWVAAEGVIYEHFDPGVHTLSRFDVWGPGGLPPADWVRWWAVDFGYTNPFVCGMWAEDPDGRLWLYREIYHSKRTVDQHATDIMAAVSVPDPDWRPRAGTRHAACEGRIWTEPKPRAIICDHDAEGREVLAREVGIGTIPAKKGVTDGIQATDKRFRERRLFICRDALVKRDQELVDAKRPTCTAEEVPMYVWERPGASARSQAPRETPVKENDHGMDQMRYLVAEREIGAPRLRSM